MAYGMVISSKRYLIILLCLPALCFLSLSLFNYLVDPYMLWHAKPLWYTTTKNPVIDHHQRLVKSLQVILRQPEVVFLGSSRVYHVINPQQVTFGKTYNLGIGSLKMTESYGYVRELVKWTPVKKIYLALDLFAFGSVQTMPGYDDELDTFQYLTNQFMGALIGKAATQYSLGILHGKGSNYDDGTWQFDGYKITPKRNAVIVNKGLKEYLTLYTTLFQAHGNQSVLSNTKTLENIIQLCQKHHVELILYFNPVNYRLYNAYDEIGVFKHLTQLKSQISALAAQYHIEVWDFATLNAVTRYPFANEAEISGNPYYLDVDHGTELTGNYIMQRMGVPLKHPDRLPADFGHRLNL